MPVPTRCFKGDVPPVPTTIYLHKPLIHPLHALRKGKKEGETQTAVDVPYTAVSSVKEADECEQENRVIPQYSGVENKLRSTPCSTHEAR